MFEYPVILSLSCSQRTLVDLWDAFDAGVKKGNGGIAQYMDYGELADVHQLIGHWKPFISSAPPVQPDVEEEAEELNVDELAGDSVSNSGTENSGEEDPPLETIIRNIACNKCQKMGVDCEDAIKQENVKKRPGRASTACIYCQKTRSRCETGSSTEVRHNLNTLLFTRSSYMS